MAGNRSDSAVFLELKGDMQKILEAINKQTKDFNKSLDTLAKNKGMDKVSKKSKEAKTNMDGVGGSMGSIIKKTAIWAAGIAGVAISAKQVFDFYKKGVEANLSTAKAENSLAGLINTLNTVEKEGKNLTGLEAFAESAKVAKDQVKQLTLEAIKSGASVTDTIEAMQAGMASGLSAGFSVDQVREMSLLMSNAVNSMNMPKNQATQELRALLSGNINKNAQIGTSLGFGSGGAFEKEYKEAMKAGKGYEFLSEKMKGFKLAGEEASKNFDGTMSKAKDVFDLFAGKSSESLTEELNKLGPLLDGLFDVNTGEFSSEIQSIADTFDFVSSIIGEGIVDGMQWIVEKATELGQYLEEDQSMFNTISLTIDMILEILSTIWTIFSEIFGIVIDLVKGLFDLSDETKSTNDNASALEKTMTTINKVLYFITLGFTLIKETVKAIADTIRLFIGAALRDMGNMLTSLLSGIASGLSLIGATETSNALKKQIEEIDQAFDNMANTVEGADNKVKKLLKGEIGYGDIYKESVQKMDDALYGGLDEMTGNRNEAFQKYKTEKKNKEEEEKRRKATEPKATFTSRAGDGKSGKKGKGEDLGKLAYEKELKELEKLLKREQDLIADKNRNIELEYAHNLISIRDYFSQKNELQDRDYKAQMENLDKQLEAIQKQKGKSAKTKDNNKVDEKELEIINQKIKLEQDYNFNIKKTGLEQKKSLKEFENGLKELRSELDVFIGDYASANKIRLQIEIEDLKEKYQAETDPETQLLIENTIKMKTEQSELNAISETFNSILDSQLAKEEYLIALKDAGRLSELDYFAQAREKREENIEQLQREIEKLEEIYNLSNSPDTLAQIDRLRAKLVELESDIDPLAKKFDDLLKDGLTDGLTDFITGTKSASEAFSDFANNIAQELTKLAMNKLLTEMFDKLFDAGTGGSGSGFGALISGLFTPRASGGRVKKGQPLLVGESGPEPFIPDSDGYIMNAAKAGSLQNGNGNGRQIVQHITIQTNDVNSFNQSSGQVSAQLGAMVSGASRNM